MANGGAVWQQTSHTTHRLSSPSSSVTPIQKGLSFNEKCWRICLCKKAAFRKSNRKGRKIMKVTEKVNQMIALRFQTGGGGHQISLASLRIVAGGQKSGV